jgi:hypothetical protein
MTTKKSPAKKTSKPKAKKPVEKAVPADHAKKSPGTKLAVVPKSTPAVKDTLEPIITPSFKKAAAENDAAITKTLDIIGKTWVSLGELFAESKAKGYHVALGFKSFADYCEAKSGKSKSQVYMAMEVVKELTSGEKPVVTKDDLHQMTQENAAAVTKLKQKGVKITPTIIDQAKNLSADSFRTKVVHKHDPVSEQKDAVKKGTTIAGSKTTTIRITYEMLPETAASMHRCSEIARYVTRDGDKETPFTDRFLQSMCAEYESANAAEYESAKAEEEAKGVNAAITTMAEAGPEQDESLLDDETVDKTFGT